MIQTKLFTPQMRISQRRQLFHTANSFFRARQDFHSPDSFFRANRNFTTQTAFSAPDGKYTPQSAHHSANALFQFIFNDDVNMQILTFRTSSISESHYVNNQIFGRKK